MHLLNMYFESKAQSVSAPSLTFMCSVCRPQESTSWWQPTSTWRGKLVTLWSRRICPASWQSSCPKCLSGSTENLSLPGLSLVSRLLSSLLNICWKKYSSFSPEGFKSVLGKSMWKTWWQDIRHSFRNSDAVELSTSQVDLKIYSNKKQTHPLIVVLCQCLTLWIDSASLYSKTDVE